MDSDDFCRSCGARYQNDPIAPPTPAPRQDAQQDNLQNSQQNTQQTNQQYTYGQPGDSAPPRQEEMSLGKWIWTIVATTFFGLISLIVAIVWAFSDGPESRQKYCKALLIVELIAIVLIIIMLIAFGALFAAIASNIIQAIRESGIDFSEIDISDIQYRLTAIASMFI